jgi:flagellar hook-length control protein FliK
VNQHTGMTAVPSASHSPSSSLARSGERADALPRTEFSAALKHEMQSDVGARSSAGEAVERPAAAPQRTAPATRSAADAGNTLPEGGKPRPQEAASASPADRPVDASPPGAETTAASQRGQVPTLEAEAATPWLSSQASPDATDEQALPEAELTSSPLEPLLDGNDDPAHGEAQAAPDPLFEFFTRTLDAQGIAVPGVTAAVVAAPLVPAAGAEAADDALATGAEAGAAPDALENALTAMRTPTEASPAGDAWRKEQPALVDESLEEAARYARLEAGAEIAADLSADAESDGADLDASAPSGALPSGASRPGENSSLFASLLPDLTRSLGRSDAPGAGSLGGSAVAGGLLSAVVGSEEWFDQLGTGLRWQVGEGVSEARLRLNPAELGTLDVQVRVTERGAEVHFLAPHAQAREALEQGMQRLRESLDAQGLQLADASVSDGRSGREGRDQQGTPLPAWTAAGWTPQEDAAGGDASVGALLQGRGLIDLYA